MPIAALVLPSVGSVAMGRLLSKERRADYDVLEGDAGFDSKKQL